MSTLFAALAACTAGPYLELQDPVPVEKFEPVKGGQGLGTKGYAPTKREAPFLKKVNEKPVAFWSDLKIPKPTNMTEEE